MSKQIEAIFFAVLAAALYAINVPLSKLLLEHVDPSMLAGFLYIGAGVGIGILLLTRQVQGKNENTQWLTKKDLPYTVAMVVLDIAAPILLMFGIANTTSANVSLLNNFEIVATSLIALLFFKEKISKNMWIAILLVTVSSGILSFEGQGAFVFNKGSLYVLGACLCWGVENNCTRSISDKNAEEIVTIKGLFSGLGGVIVALILRESFPPLKYILLVMLLGFFSYGLSITFYILAQKALGAAKTSAFYAIAPFLGVGFSCLYVRERPGGQFWIALAVMALSTVIMVLETLGKGPFKGYTHTHEHRHGDVVHTHAHRHLGYNPMHLHVHSHEGVSSTSRAEHPDR